MLDVRRLRLLRELAHLGTIAAVAEALSFSPSAVSQQLSVLEKEAGVPLLERTGRRVALTPAGLGLVRHAEAVLERLEQADAELAHARQGLAGPLRIGTYPSAARAILPALLAELAGWHPGLEPMVTEVDPAAVAAALRAGELDVALVHEYDLVPADPEPGLAVTRPVFTEPMYLAALGPGTIAGQRSAPWIMAPPGTLCHSMAVRACESAGFAPRIRHQIDDFATVLALVAAGQGVALVPHLGTAQPPSGVVLTRLPMYRRTRAAFRAGAGSHPAISAFVSALHTAVPPGLGGES
ncbi:LysR family transcriptional regulator [Streptomyces sp. CB01881]|uniref:LysR family transcriptional regulator n=1 Tax=Streptomyces sp. CB01881 TaxID=2078691 RepID=UPI000CDC7E2B|nr:LysR family transcriptional regulator [Streptomyces sp. CB01881]AUY52153.1 LysR family transcriptional regulator [Streptomyces sp. CB01881]TYC71580.1 LysR family transcriptional regulator [Streptomyces sp. CB01881]